MNPYEGLKQSYYYPGASPLLSMAVITKAFGTNATIDASTPSAPVLTVHWSDLSSSLTGSGSSPGTTSEDWLAAILYYAADNLSLLDPSARVATVQVLTTSLSLYNNSRQRTYSLQTSFYEPDSGANRPSSVNL